MIVKLLLELPQTIIFDDVVFDFSIFKNGEQDLRICYEAEYANKNSPHYEIFNNYGCWHNPFINSNCSFLLLIENISTDKDLLKAISETSEFITKNNLI